MHIESYKTDVKTKEDASFIVVLLRFIISDCSMDFVVDDSNHILKIETNREIKEMVYGVFNKQGFYCQKL
ncbi:hypothetical protein DBB36_18500 [Flavobacterium sp. WLB]|jgi:hypothetical protein|uniref:Uncharacterized protein n=1 Tax=Flavobacterium panici TaxID=2654843 RepID=A0A9N8J200_9FLAO|nr:MULTISPECIES: hypothetical protein [Flavobacterium]KOP39760.1 hypothetical protein AKO67_02425 [Flavobacterium sp. VMW]MDR6762133.1 hypothetical protein [Flavobacterium sp. 2755]OWU92544.1 hypothetical protein APR43_00335 [Flavobacterium sp. NLM]PUU68521.1 hypothetical protein DBB36_18500 [Flavobacterium sp. WLB]UUF12871.1 hypothetical protein NLJ00_16560 [Flavobacterium panici]